jgi:Helix-turn-helix domain
MNFETPEVIDAAEVADLLKLKVSWVRDHTTRIEPILPHIKLGRKVRYELREILRFIREHREDRPIWGRQTSRSSQAPDAA